MSAGDNLPGARGQAPGDEPSAPRGPVLQEGPALPPMVLHCRPRARAIYGVTALSLLVLGTDALVSLVSHPRPGLLDVATPLVLLVFGAGAAYFVARYTFATVRLDDSGFRMQGPLVSHEVRWHGVGRWERLPRSRRGPAFLRIVHGEDRRRLTLPLIYEDDHLLELGLAQRRFPRD